MALTVNTAINRVLARFAEGETPLAYPADLEGLIPKVLERTAEMVAVHPNPNVRQLLRKDFSISIASGVGSLASAFADAEPPLLSALPLAYMVTTAGDLMHNLPDRVQLGLTRPVGFFIYWTNDNSTLRTRNKDGSLTSLTTTVTGTTQYVPAITSVNGKELEEIFLDEFEKLIRARPATQEVQAT